MSKLLWFFLFFNILQAGEEYTCHTISRDAASDSEIIISTGTVDSFIESSDELVKCMKQHDMQVAYHRLQDVPHDQRVHAPKIFDVTATCLQNILENQR